MDLVNYIRTAPVEAIGVLLFGLIAGFGAGFKLKRFGLMERIERLEEEKQRLKGKLGVLEEEYSELEQLVSQFPAGEHSRVGQLSVRPEPKPTPRPPSKDLPKVKHVPETDSAQVPDVPPAVRLLPMTSAEFNGWTAKEVQSQFFLAELGSWDRGGEYKYRTSGLKAEPGTVVLFQYDNRIIASAVFENRKLFDVPDGAYRGALYFDPTSIRVFDPVGAEVLREVWPDDFDGFSQVKQSLNAAAYPEFVRRLIGVKSPPGAKELIS